MGGSTTTTSKPVALRYTKSLCYLFGFNYRHFSCVCAFLEHQYVCRRRLHLPEDQLLRPWQLTGPTGGKHLPQPWSHIRQRNVSLSSSFYQHVCRFLCSHIGQVTVCVCCAAVFEGAGVPIILFFPSLASQHVPGVQPEGSRRHIGALHQPAERLPHHQGGAEALQNTRGRREGEGGHRQARLAGHQPQPQQPQTQRPLHQTQHRTEEDAGLTGGSY